MAWRLARSLSTLRSEIVARYPGTTVWTIGDQTHASGWSDHNPNSDSVVCAIDIKTDGGLNLQRFVDHLVARPHRALKYVIYNRRIWSKTRASEGWRPYGGVNAHRDHVHVSVGTGPDGRSTGPYDDTSPWGIATIGKPSPPSTGIVPAAPLREGDTGPRVGHLQRALNAAVDAGLTVDDHYGPNTTAGVKLLQRTVGIDEDGIYGDDSADALRDLLEDDMPINDADAKKIWLTDGIIDAPSDAGDRATNTHWAPASALRGTLDRVYHLPGELKAIKTEQAAAKLREEAILAAVKGLDTKAVIATVNAAATADATRDAALLAEVQELVSGGATAQEIVDQLALRLAGGE